MNSEMIWTGKTVEAAVQSAARHLSIDPSQVEYEVIAQPKKGFLGIGEVPAKIRVKKKAANDPAERALDFMETLLRNMGITARLELVDGKDDDKLIRVSGEQASALIGHHGETLEQLQYLVGLAANRRAEDVEQEYVRITVDIEDYRVRREAALRALAQRMAEKCKRTGRNVILEPMSPAERRIIHTELQSFDGVSTKSIGQEENRRVLLYNEQDGPEQIG